MKQTNFHTHTWRCNHANGSDEEYVLEAIENDFEILGFADHCCWKYDSGFDSLDSNERTGISSLQKQYHESEKKYAKDINIRLGMEAEYFLIRWIGC